ncbi:MAG: D-2-hydroxyacid dehydrogenase [Anaerovorax sp.]
MNIVILDDGTINPGDLSWAKLEQFGTLTTYDRTASLPLAIERSREAQIVLTSKVSITSDFIDACPKLKMIGVLATGYNNIDVSYAKSKGIVITNIPAYASEIVAQHTMALLLEICQLPPQPLSLKGKTLGIIGYGNISKKVISIASAFGMNVLIFSHYPDSSVENHLISFCDLEQLLVQSHVVSLHCPMTAENTGFLNKEFINKMKTGVIILNTSRGGLINSQDLASAISTGKVAYAGLDVLEEEPPRSGNPLIGMDHVLITPHIAWSAKETRARLIDIAIDNVKGFLEKKFKNTI